MPPEEVAEPARIAVLDHGRHASLILETGDGEMVVYAYGDWRWYAQRDTGVAQGSSALLWPTPATLGRRRLPGPFSEEAVARAVRPRIEQSHHLTVEAGAVEQLTTHLDRTFDGNADSRLYNRAYDLVFVRLSEEYWLFNNSNQRVARWLEQLGCRIDGPALLSDWSRGRAQPSPW